LQATHERDAEGKEQRRAHREHRARPVSKGRARTAPTPVINGGASDAPPFAPPRGKRRGLRFSRYVSASVTGFVEGTAWPSRKSWASKPSTGSRSRTSPTSTRSCPPCC